MTFSVPEHQFNSTPQRNISSDSYQMLSKVPNFQPRFDLPGMGETQPIEGGNSSLSNQSPSCKLDSHKFVSH